MKNRILSIILVFCMCISLLPTTVLAKADALTAAEYLASNPAGAGTDYILDTGNKTLIIKNGKGAAFFNANSNSYLSYIITLNADIDVSGFRWMPVGNFNGTFDGNGHTISGMTIYDLIINNNFEQCTGMFSKIESDGIVKNLTVDGTLTVNTGSDHENCYAGGIAGINSGIIDHCINNSAITVISGSRIFSQYSVGGISGNVSNGIIRNCGNTGNVSANAIALCQDRVSVGGIAGFYNNSNDAVIDCYNTGNISGSSIKDVIAGGIVADFFSGYVKNCYSSGAISAICKTEDSHALIYAGGICGLGGNMTNCYYKEDTATVIGNSEVERTYIATSCGTFADNGGTLTAGTVGNCGAAQTLAYGNTLLDSLNGWVNTEKSTNYYTWVADSIPCINSGYPVFDAEWEDNTESKKLAAKLNSLIAGSAILSGRTVTMQTNVVLNVEYKITEGEIILDLNGKTITGANGIATPENVTFPYYNYNDRTGKSAFIVKGGTFTVKDSGTDGKIVGGNGVNDMDVWADAPPGGEGVYVEGGTVNILGGTFTGGNGSDSFRYRGGYGASGVSLKDGTLTIKKGNFVGGVGGAGSVNRGNGGDGKGIRILKFGTTFKSLIAADVAFMIGEKIENDEVKIGAAKSVSVYDVITVTFKSNYIGGGTDYTQIIRKGTDAALEENTFNITGYTFKQWNTNPNGIDIDFCNKSVVNSDINITLYAIWTPISYTVKFNGNGATGGSMSGQSFTYDEAGKALTKNVFEKTGYTFKGWATSTTGKSIYSDGQSVQNLTATAGDTINLYAVWADETNPTGKITIGNFWWEDLVNTLTFGVFFKEDFKVTVEASDLGNNAGDVSIEYYIDTNCDVAKTVDKLDMLTFTVYDSDNKPTAGVDGKNVVYVKLTDAAGNVTYISSAGLALYTDAMQNAENIDFTRTSNIGDLSAKVALNGNAVNTLKCGDTVLIKNTHYTVDGNGIITLKAEWVKNNLNNTEKVYTFTVSYNPLGLTYVDAVGNDAPATTIFTVTVKRTTTTIKNLSDISKVYDELPVADITYSTNSDADKSGIVVKYKKTNEQDSAFTTTKPTAAGNYFVNITIPETDNYSSLSTTVQFSICYSDVPVSPYSIEQTASEDGWYNRAIQIFPKAGYEISCDGCPWANVLIISSTTDANFGIWLRDSQGQITDKIIVGTIKIDDVAPTIDVVGNITDYLVNDTVTVNAGDDLSGIKKIEVKKDDDSFTDITSTYGNGYKVNANGTYTFKATDRAGNEQTDSVIYSKIDCAKPEVVLDSNGYTGGEWVNSDVTLKVTNSTLNLGTATFEYKLGDGDWQTYPADGVTVSADTIGTYTFRIISAAGVASDGKAITVKLDKTPADASAEISGTAWDKLLETITFGLYHNTEKWVTITVTDSGSDVDKVYYFIDVNPTVAKDESALESAPWIEYDQNAKPKVDTDCNYVVYVKTVDKAGNIRYISTQCVVYDTFLPTIDGISDGATYYTTQNITVDDINIKSVTVNTVRGTNYSFALPGNVDKTYTVVVTDKAGNSKTYTVTMKTIASIGKSIESLTGDNVKSSDKAMVEAGKAAVVAVNTNTATGGEKSELKAITDKCDALLKKISDTGSEIDRIEVGVKGIDIATVTSEDKEDIEGLVASMGVLKATDNLTNQELNKLDGLKEKAVELIMRIRDITDFIAKTDDEISKFNSDSVTSADKENLLKTALDIDKVLEKYVSNLTDGEKDQLKKMKEKISGLIKKIDDATEALITENIQKIKGVNVNNVQPMQMVALQNALEDLSTTLENHSGNYTQQEKKEIEDRMDVIKTALDLIDRVNGVAAKIEAIPTADNIKLTDKEAIEALEADYNALSAYEKTLVDSEKLIAAIIALGKLESGNGTPLTGDSNYMLWFTLAVASMLGILCSYRGKKKISY